MTKRETYWDVMEWEEKWMRRIGRWFLTPLLVILVGVCIFEWGMVLTMMVQNIWSDFSVRVLGL